MCILINNRQGKGNTNHPVLSTPEIERQVPKGKEKETERGRLVLEERIETDNPNPVPEETGTKKDKFLQKARIII